MRCRHSIAKTSSEPAAKARFRRWPSVRIALVLLLGAFSLNARQPGEYDVKAAFLLNFAKFVEWPAKAFPDANAPVIIGIVGDDPFGDVLPLLVQGQTAQGRRIQIRRFADANEIGDCHLLFLSRSVAGRTGEILQRLRERPVVTVSEKEDFVRQGGMIGFALVDKTVRFDINTKAAEAVAVKLSSKLLAVARSVVKSS